MHISEVMQRQAEKDHLMRHEGKHPANETEMHHFKHSYGEMHGVDPYSHGAELL